MVKLRLEAVLKEKKISKRGFAKMLGIDYANVFRFFREDYDPKLSTVEQWAETLGVRMSDLYQDKRPSSRRTQR